MDVLLVVDMQEGLLRGDPKHDPPAVVERINRLAARVRQRGGSVFFVQHAGPVGDEFEPFTPGWSLLSSIKRESSDRIVSKTLNDAFFRTSRKPVRQHAAAWVAMVTPTSLNRRGTRSPLAGSCPSRYIVTPWRS